MREPLARPHAHGHGAPGPGVRRQWLAAVYVVALMQPTEVVETAVVGAGVGSWDWFGDLGDCPPLLLPNGTEAELIDEFVTAARAPPLGSLAAPDSRRKVFNFPLTGIEPAWWRGEGEAGVTRDQWWYADNGTQVGEPVSAAQLRDELAELSATLLQDTRRVPSGRGNGAAAAAQGACALAELAPKDGVRRGGKRPICLPAFLLLGPHKSATTDVFNVCTPPARVCRQSGERGRGVELACRKSHEISES